MSQAKQTSQKLSRLRERYAAQLPKLLGEIESCWDSVVDSHWDSLVLHHLLQIIHRIAGSSVSYGYRQINGATKLVEATLTEILENPIGATSELQERLETQLDLLRTAFREIQNRNYRMLKETRPI